MVRKQHRRPLSDGGGQRVDEVAVGVTEHNVSEEGLWALSGGGQ